MKKLTWPKAKRLLDGHIFRTFCFNVKQYFVAEKINNLTLQDISIFLAFCTTSEKFLAPDQMPLQL